MRTTVIELACQTHPDRTWSQGLLVNGQGYVRCPDCGHGDHVAERTQIFRGWSKTLLSTKWDGADGRGEGRDSESQP